MSKCHCHRTPSETANSESLGLSWNWGVNVLQGQGVCGILRVIPKWHFSCFTEVTSIKISMNFSSYRKFLERDRQDLILVWEGDLFGPADGVWGRTSQQPVVWAVKECLGHKSEPHSLLDAWLRTSCSASPPQAHLCEGKEPDSCGQCEK